MFCKKCGGIEEVVKIYETDDFSPRVCDVQCLDCGEMKYAQPYDFGSIINKVITPKTQKSKEIKK